MARIFLSHSRRDRDFVRRLARDIAKRGHQVWVDEAEIRVGDSLLEKIQEAINQMDFVGVVISRNSIKSKWVQTEVEIAATQEIAGRRVKILPLLLETVPIPMYLKSRLYADFTTEELYRDSLRKVVNRLNEHLTPSGTSRQILQTSFWEFSHIQGNGIDPLDPADPEAALEGSSLFELEIFNCTKQKLRTHAIQEWKPLPDLIRLISPCLAVLTGRKRRELSFGFHKSENWSRTKYWPWLHRHHIDVFQSVPRNRPYDGFLLEINRTQAIFQPWCGGNPIEGRLNNRFSPLISELTQPLKKLVSGLLDMKSSQMIFGPLQAYKELPGNGGFGYIQSWSKKI